MEFYTAYHEKRPVRLSQETRCFAWESLQGRYGEETLQTPSVSLNDTAGFETMTEYQKYDEAIMAIAANAPLRICENEKISGAATLGRAMGHVVPVTYRGKGLWDSVSHVTLGFDKVLKSGINGIEREIDERLSDISLQASGKEILGSMKNTIASMHIWHNRYLGAVKASKPAVYHNLLQVPFEPARNFYEAVQSLWFVFSFVRLCGNWPGIGRIDEMLGGYLKQDLDAGVLTLNDAREILAGFFIKGCEWIQKNTPVGNGDAQHYQNIILSGIDQNGDEVTNDVTYLVLDIVEELGISDFPISVRLNRNSPRELLVRMAEVIRHGGGVVAAYNEELIIDSLLKFGYSLSEARRFANDGCWEIQIPGKTNFGYIPFDSLYILLHDTLGLDGDAKHYATYEELYESFLDHLHTKVEKIYDEGVRRFATPEPGKAWEWSPAKPCSVMSIFTEGCIETGRSYLGGGAKYSVISPHIGGAPDVGNSLYAIRKLVFEDEKVTFGELMAILQNNWEGNEPLRQYVRNKYTYYGNDDDEADAYTSKVLNDFADMVGKLNGRTPILFPAGVSTFGRQIEWAPFRAAVPFGFKRGEILSGNTSPTPGTDASGATATIKSYCKADLRRQTSGAALDVKLYPATVQGVNGVETLVALLNGFLQLGGFFIQLDVMDQEALRQAQEHPENYKTLSVRVSGWNARFVTLNKEWQQMIIERTAQGA